MAPDQRRSGLSGLLGPRSVPRVEWPLRRGFRLGTPLRRWHLHGARHSRMEGVGPLLGTSISFFNLQRRGTRVTRLNWHVRLSDGSACWAQGLALGRQVNCYHYSVLPMSHEPEPIAFGTGQFSDEGIEGSLPRACSHSRTPE